MPCLMMVSLFRVPFRHLIPQPTTPSNLFLGFGDPNDHVWEKIRGGDAILLSDGVPSSLSSSTEIIARHVQPRWRLNLGLGDWRDNLMLMPVDRLHFCKALSSRLGFLWSGESKCFRSFGSILLWQKNCTLVMGENPKHCLYAFLLATVYRLSLICGNIRFVIHSVKWSVSEWRQCLNPFHFPF